MKHTQQIGRLIEAELFSTLKQDRFCKGDQGNSRIQHMAPMEGCTTKESQSFCRFLFFLKRLLMVLRCIQMEDGITKSAERVGLGKPAKPWTPADYF